MSKTTTRSLQTDVQRAIDQMVESGAERGLQVAVYRNGEQIVDAVAGVADPASGRLYTSDTPVYCYSVCKAAASLGLAHDQAVALEVREVLADRVGGHAQVVGDGFRARSALAPQQLQDFHAGRTAGDHEGHIRSLAGDASTGQTS